MADKLKNNIGLKIVALAFAFLLWFVVVNIDDPIDNKTYQVDVTVLNPDVITNAGKSYQVVDNTGSVAITVKARRKVLSNITPSNIIATADLREMQDTSVPIRISITGFEGQYESVSANPRNIQVKVENTQKKTFPITGVATGKTRDGFVVGELIPSPKTIDVSGPESLIAKISKVVAKVDVSELAMDTSLETKILYYDAADNLIDQSRLSSNCDKSGVSVFVDIWNTKNIDLIFDTSSIRTARGYVFAGIEVEPQKLEVSGSPDKLKDLEEIKIDKSVLKKTGLKANEEVLVDIQTYLPEGISLVDSNLGKVVVRIKVEKAGTKTLDIPTGSISVLNAPNLKLEYEKQGIEVTFTGKEDALNSLTMESLTNGELVVAIDLVSFQSKGTHTVPLLVTKLPTGCTYSEDVTVQIKLSKK